MATNLTAVRDALEGLTDIELRALVVATNEAPRVAYGLLVWIEGACDWETNRRRGFDYELQPPEAAIDPSEDAVSVEAIYAMRAAFAAGDMAPAVLKFFDALVALLTGRGQRH
jgi:hypothetical protein